jgi:hypothetical protein
MPKRNEKPKSRKPHPKDDCVEHVDPVAAVDSGNHVPTPPPPDGG